MQDREKNVAWGALFVTFFVHAFLIAAAISKLTELVILVQGANAAAAILTSLFVCYNGEGNDEQQEVLCGTSFLSLYLSSLVSSISTLIALVVLRASNNCIIVYAVCTSVYVIIWGIFSVSLQRRLNSLGNTQDTIHDSL